MLKKECHSLENDFLLRTTHLQMKFMAKIQNSACVAC